MGFCSQILWENMVYLRTGSITTVYYPHVFCNWKKQRYDRNIRGNPVCNSTDSLNWFHFPYRGGSEKEF